MKLVPRPVVLSALCTCVLFASACGSPPPPQQSSKDGGGSTQRTGAGGGASPEPARRLPVDPAGAAADDGSAKVSRASGRGTGRSISGKGLRMSSYDAKADKAVLSRSGADASDVRKGDVIASPPTGKLPAGALVKVTGVRSSSDRKTEVDTAPSNLTELFGNTKAQGEVPVDPAAWKVNSLAEGVDVIREDAGKAGEDGKAGEERNAGGVATGENRNGKKDGPGKLRIDLGSDFPLPGGKGGFADDAKLGGSLEMSPKVAFSYDRRSAGDRADANASIRLDGSYKANWKLKGSLGPTEGTVRVPLAGLAAFPVIMVGPVPVVVALRLTLLLEIKAGGEVTVAVDQESAGSMTVGAEYTKADGWKPDVRADGAPAKGGKARLNGKGELRTLLGPEVSVGLYDAVGVAVTFGPYLRGTLEGPKGGAKDGVPAADRRRGRWKLFGGVNLEGSLFAGLPGRVHGLPLPGYRHRIPVYNREWPIAAGRTPAPETLPLPAGS